MALRPSVSRRTVLLGGLLAFAGCSGEEPPSLPELVVATGPPGAVFREIGAALAGVLADRLPDTRVETVETAASAENLRLLAEGAVHVAFTSLDAAVGHGGRPSERLRALGRVYDSHLHLVVPAGSDVEELADLAGRRVSYGARDSGTEFTVERLAELTGLDVDDVRLDQASSARALTSGEIDALFSLTGIPTPAVFELASQGDVRFVPLREEADLLADAYPGPYIPATIPATIYPGIPACDTVAVPNLLVVGEELSDEVARIVTETVFTQARTIAADRPEATHINVRTGIATGPVPLHPGARAWFREQKA
ncbi:TAXI family TRAP transporter solute-binding subunit [Marinactinospora thermotolerans]|uniref:TRAP transporter solute receptor, TAXI family n=1 Tax=Marinactinospora thermotolerans DSM 45154 TaxID=1122192 RepID=A0A1T4N5F2_9ACTN|nr:TAXI family TRAP transporter solute-binding subunit [Marinactinospora thermotolerans]SJZ74336.1 hypothetical protein SAMN02745673_01279 [Marinactinospora thermotolerans DSM 45154]